MFKYTVEYTTPTESVIREYIAHDYYDLEYQVFEDSEIEAAFDSNDAIEWTITEQEYTSRSNNG